MSAIQFEKNADNIVILTLDSPNQSANTMNADFRIALTETVEKLKADDNIAGIIFRSNKKTFFRHNAVSRFKLNGTPSIVALFSNFTHF